MARRRPIRRGILSKILLLTLVPATLLLGLFGLYAYAQARASLEDEMSRRLVGLARSLVTQVDPPQVLVFAPGDEQTRTYHTLADRLRLLAEMNDAARVYVAKADETLLFDTEPVTRVGETMYQLAGHRREMKLVWQKKPVASTMFKGADGLFYKSGYAPLEMNGEVVAMLGVDAGVRFFARLRAIRRNLTFLALFGLAAFAFGSVVFARRLLLPIRRLARSATRIGEGDYHTPIAEKTGDEIELLAETLNDMRARIVERDRYLQMMQRGIAHEVRNPLGGMELYCDILSDELAARPELLPHVDKIRHEIKTLDAVVNEFLDFTKDQVAEKKPVELREFLADLLMFYAGLAETQNVIIEKHLDQPNAAAVFDPDLLRRALHNLLLNAIQAMPDGGRLRVEVRCRAGVLEFVIADTGKGIPAAIRDSVFAPFFTTKEKGTGLGLPFARKIVESLGGELTLASDEGAGTQVTIRLPQPAAEEGQS